MKILKTLSIAAGLAFFAVNISAQDRAPVTAQQMTDKVKQNVTGITAAQESKILAVEQEFLKTMQDARTASNGDRKAMKAKMQPAREARDTKIKAILTVDQYAQYQKAEAAHKGGGHKGGN